MRKFLLATLGLMFAACAAACGSSSDNAGSAGSTPDDGDSGSEPTDGGTDSSPDTAEAAPDCTGIDLQSDSKNCGKCGHDCLGGACTSGACGLVELLQIDDGSFSGLAVADGTLYVANYSTQSMLKVPLAGGAYQELGPLDATFTPRKMAIDSQYIYATTDGQLSAIDRANGTTKKLTSVGDPEPSDVILAGNALYVASGEEYGSDILRYDLGSGTTTTVTSLVSTFSWSWRTLHASSDRVAWADDMVVSWIPIAGGAITKIQMTPATQPPYMPFRLRIDDTAVYVLVQEQSNNSFASLQQLPFDGSDHTVLTVSEDTPIDVEIDATHVYLLDRPCVVADCRSRITRFDKGGTSGTVLYDEAGKPERLERDDVSLYLLEETRVLRMAF